MSNGSSYGCEETIESVRARTSVTAPSLHGESCRFDWNHSNHAFEHILQTISLRDRGRDRYPMDDADRLPPRERYTRRETTRTGRQKNTHARARARTANVRALGLLSVAFTLPMTFPLGFFAAEPSRASGENCKYSDFFPSSNGSNPRSPGSEPSSHAGRSPNGNAICVESRAFFSSVDPDRNGGRARAPRATSHRPRVSRSHAPRPDRRAGRSRSPFSPAPSSPVSSPRASRATPSSSPASPSSSPSRSSWSSSSSSRVAEWRRDRGGAVDRGVVTGRSGRPRPRGDARRSRGSRS